MSVSAVFICLYMYIAGNNIHAESTYGVFFLNQYSVFGISHNINQRKFVHN